MRTLNNHVIELLESELCAVIEESKVLAAQIDYEKIDPLVEALSQIRGVLVLTNLDGLARLFAELVTGVQAAAASEIDREEFKSLLMISLDAASNFARSLILAKTENTCVLLPEITALRRLRGQPPLYEYHCLSELSWPVFNKETSSKTLAGEQQEDVKRLLHLYQFGLLDIIKDNNRDKAFVILYRVAQRLENIAISKMEQDYWWVLSVVLRALAEGRLEMQVERVRLLAAVEKQLRLLAAENPGEGRNPYPEGLWRAFVSLAALNKAKNAEESERRLAAEIPELDFTELDIIGIRRSILGDASVDRRELFKSLKDLVADARALLDSERSEEAEINSAGIIVELSETFEKLVTPWEQAGFDGMSRRFKQYSTRLQSFRPDEDLSTEMLGEFVDAILQAECALAEFQNTPPTDKKAKSWENRPLIVILQDSLLKTAQITVMDESEIHLGEAKEMLSDVAAGYAGEELIAELESVFQVICGSARMLDMVRLVELTNRCVHYIREVLFIDPAEQKVSNYWEVFADCIACLEYYISGCKSGDRDNERSLDIASECLTSLGV